MEKGLRLCPDASFTGTDSGDVISPLRISGDGVHGPKFNDPVQVSCGATHIVLVAYDETSYCLGAGEEVEFLEMTKSLTALPHHEDFKQEELNQPDKTIDKRISNEC
ncbi:hypothetical protein V6N11_044176 [Hibiscus sabdariffa]|uniref:Uncharacterized protein n=1 Tax=Hibiscus sabdariffa TaxID=183260 RepID=A0ABR2REJ9_9ROSI